MVQTFIKTFFLMRVPCDNLLGIFQMPFFGLVVLIFFPQYIFEVLIFWLLSFYFFYNSLCVYYFEDDKIIKKNRIFKIKNKHIYYHELVSIRFDRVFAISMNNRISFKAKKEAKLQNLPNIMISNWSDVEEIIAFLKDKDVKLIINN